MQKTVEHSRASSLLTCTSRSWKSALRTSPSKTGDKCQESIVNVSFRELLLYGWVNIPLVYTQLVTIAVNVYFLVALFGRQYLTPTK